MNEKPLIDHPRFKTMDKRRVKKELKKWKKLGITKFIAIQWQASYNKGLLTFEELTQK